MASWLLVHSPLLGPASWRAVAAQLVAGGDEVVVPDLRPGLRARHGFAAAQAQLAATSIGTGQVQLAGHGGAGPLLPAVASLLAQRSIEVTRAIFVDAGRPHPGLSRRSTLPAELADHLATLTVDGWLPPWPQWWPSARLAALLPDLAVRAELIADCPPLPAGLFDEPLPAGAQLPASGYLQLSAGYAEQAAAAAADGWPLRRLEVDHLAPLTCPGKVANAMRDVAADASAMRNAARRQVARFNRAVQTGSWTQFASSFAADARMTFTNIPVGPFTGREAIEQAYRAQPPDDTMTIDRTDQTGPDACTVRFTWNAGGPGSMRIRWRDGLVADLEITFG